MFSSCTEFAVPPFFKVDTAHSTSLMIWTYFSAPDFATTNPLPHSYTPLGCPQPPVHLSSQAPEHGNHDPGLWLKFLGSVARWRGGGGVKEMRELIILFSLVCAPEGVLRGKQGPSGEYRIECRILHGFSIPSLRPSP